MAPRTTGFVSLHRSIMDCEIWPDLELSRVFETLLMLADFEGPNRGMVSIKQTDLQKRVGFNPSRSTLQRLLKKLEKLEMITSKPGNKSDATSFTITRYDEYQKNRKSVGGITGGKRAENYSAQETFEIEDNTPESQEIIPPAFVENSDQNEGCHRDNRAESGHNLRESQDFWAENNDPQTRTSGAIYDGDECAAGRNISPLIKNKNNNTTTTKREEKIEKTKTSATKDDRDPNTPLRAEDKEQLWNTFWNGYPKEAPKNKTKAKAAFEAKIITIQQGREFLTTFWKYKQRCEINRTDDQYVQEPLTFIGKWEQNRDDFEDWRLLPDHEVKARMQNSKKVFVDAGKVCC